jgi:PPOX class probable F420-dependent enzyme
VPNPPTAILADRVRAFLDEPHFASLATVRADGAAHQAIIWYRLEPDGRILVNSREGRLWPANMKRDPRVSLAVFWSEDPNRWVGFSGTVDEVVEDVARAREDICELAARDDTPSTLATFRSQPRVSFRIRIERVHDHLEDD